MYKNQIILEGFLGNDPEPRTLPSGDEVVNLSLATKESWEGTGGQPMENTQWHRLVFYGQRAQRASSYQKGDNLHIEGKAITRQYTDAKEHAKSVHEVIVMRSHRIDRMQADEEMDESPPVVSSDSGDSARPVAPASPRGRKDAGMASF